MSGLHAYLSTGCLHGDLVLPDGRTGHEYCQSNTGATGAKTPAVCKFCAAPCSCPCHEGVGMAGLGAPAAEVAVTDPMVAWLEAELRRIEELARAAGGDGWALQEHPSDTVAIYDSHREPVVYDEGWPSDEQKLHIARHDPASALRRVAADRETLALHSEPHSCPPSPSNLFWDTEPCRTVLLLAEAYGWTGEA